MCYKPPGAESSIVVTPAWCLWCRCVLWVLSRIFDQLDEWSDRSPNEIKETQAVIRVFSVLGGVGGS